MNLRDLSLDETMTAEMDALRHALGRLPLKETTSAAYRPTALLSQAERLLSHLAGWLLDDEQRQALGAHPVLPYFLHAAACLCDIGLVDGDGPFDAEAAARRTHDRIRQEWQALGITDASRADILARICLDMAVPTETEPTDVEELTPDVDGVPIHTGLIAAAICLTRDLELKSAVSFAAIVDHLPLDPQNTATRLLDAFTVDHVGPHPYFPATIQVRISCRDAELHRALKHYERVVVDRLNRLNQHIRPRFLFSDVIFEIEPDGYQPVDLRFSVDTSAALQLFMGNRLYSDKRVFLRELIQNAVDACSLRKLADNAYSPAIAIAFNHDISQITVSDNGIGMDRQWLEKYFLSIGISFYRSDDIQQVNRDPRIDIGFISQFGIGFLSSFLVAERIVIKTRKAGSSGLMVTITSLKDYFDVRPLDEATPVGTTVTLHLKPSRINYCRSMEFVGYLKTNIRFLQIPVRFTDENGLARTIGNEPLSYAAGRMDDGDVVAPIDFADAEGYVYLGLKLHDGRIFALESASGGVSVFQDGIFVTQDDSLLPEGARQNVVGRINLKGRDKCELSMDRNRLFWTGNQKHRIRQHVRMALADVANQVMDQVHGQDTPERTRTSIINHLAIFFDFGDVDDAVHDRLCRPLQKVIDKRFRDFVRVHFAHTRSKAGVPDADGYGERWQRRVLATFAPKN
jgi:hypothetical protein